MANPNIVGVQYIRGRTASRKYVKKESRYLVRNSANSNEILKINTLRATNTSKATKNLTVQLISSDGTSNVISNFQVPPKTTLSVIEKNFSIYLEENSSLNVFSTSSNDSISVFCSYEQISTSFTNDRSDIYDGDEPVPIPPALYDFTGETHTFTTAGLSGITGPSLAQLQAAYSSKPWASNTSILNMTTLGMQSWMVPRTGVYEFEVVGAKAGNGITPGGNGGRVKGNIELTAGEIIHITVGQTSVDGNGGYGGGGSGGRGGGGASDVRRGGTALTDRIIVAGGAGGGSNYSSSDRGVGGDGGYPNGTGYFPVTTASNYAIFTGGGGTQTAGGVVYSSGGAGAFGVGGAGASGVGGGGGGGWYGGAGGTYWTPGANTAVPGGGGSSYYNPALFSEVVTNTGFNTTGNGYVKITYLGPA